MKILLAEDTKDLNKVLCAVLEHEGYDVDAAFDGEEALEFVNNDSYDCLIFDIMMPKKDGIEALKEVREKKIVTPVLMLTAKAEVDYLTKPFAMKELLARVRALTRRKNEYEEGDVTYNDVTLKAQTFELSAKNSVRLSVKEFELMQLSMRNTGRSLTAEFILSNVWSREPDADPDTAWLYVSYLKRKLKAIAANVEITGDLETGFTLK